MAGFRTLAISNYHSVNPGGLLEAVDRSGNFDRAIPIKVYNRSGVSDTQRSAPLGCIAVSDDRVSVAHRRQAFLMLSTRPVDHWLVEQFDVFYRQQTSKSDAKVFAITLDSLLLVSIRASSRTKGSERTYRPASKQITLSIGAWLSDLITGARSWSSCSSIPNGSRTALTTPFKFTSTAWFLHKTPSYESSVLSPLRWLPCDVGNKF